MENRKTQFLGFVTILLTVGFLQYFRKVITGYKLSKARKILYLSTMITFTIGSMYVMYTTTVDELMAFSIGLFITTFSEHIAKSLITMGDNFNSILGKLIKKYTKIDITSELTSKEDKN